MIQKQCDPFTINSGVSTSIKAHNFAQLLPGPLSISALATLNLIYFPGAARVGVWVLRWTHRFYLEDQNLKSKSKLSSIFDIDNENNIE